MFSFDTTQEKGTSSSSEESGFDFTASKIQNGLFDWLDVIVFSVVIVIILFTFFFRLVSIDGDSMQNTLHNKERVIISNLFYEPKYRDIVVISKNGLRSDLGQKPIIKRVIATEGQKVDIDFDKGIVYVDDKPLDEPYIKDLTHRKLDVQFPVYVKKGYVFVLGDNRNDSIDSRSSMVGLNGLINKKYILGHALFRIFPLNKFGNLLNS